MADLPDLVRIQVRAVENRGDAGHIAAAALLWNRLDIAWRVRRRRTWAPISNRARLYIGT